MKTTSILIAFLITSIANAQWWGSEKVKGNGNMVTKERNLVEYNEVAVAGSFDVALVSGKEGKLVIEAEENLIEYIETENVGSKLKIRVKKGYNIVASNGKKILVTVPFTDISKVSLSGSGDVYTKNTIKATQFSAALAGSGDLVLEVDATNVEGSIAGSGDIVLKGKTNNFECSVAGSGDIDAFGLNAGNTEVSISGSGNANVSCNGGMLKSRIAGSGNVTYKGEPAKTDSKVVGSGNLRKG